MIRLRAYAGISTLATLSVIYHAFSSRGQFYPATVYLSTSKISLVILLNMGLVLMLALWNLVKLVFLGSPEKPSSWRFSSPSLSSDRTSPLGLSLVVTLLLIKALHWMAQKRVEYIETTPSVTLLSHVRIVSFMVFLLILDGLFTYTSIRQYIQTPKASMSVFFTFEYMILATTTLSVIVKYAFYVTDLVMEGQWEGKPVYTFYLELVRDLLHLSMYLCFFLMIFINFKIRVTDYLRYRKIASNMNDRFPDATPDELSSNDATCIICREEMTSAKKLVCGHLFHVHCLRSWLERQNTCPTCRALVVPTENATSTASAAHQVSLQQQGTGTSSSDGQSSSVAASGNLSRHEARVRAAASVHIWEILCHSSLPQAELESQKRCLESQIEVLQNQLRLLKEPAATTVDIKGKSVVETAE
ncbi:hypothetical protein Bca52824_024074 [Brassica carinata]|uniref:RING-type E3 ubiquitin transferase n=1 Tax=Brassica carinata TaxID=52824 RepID=A0A8X8AV77_BRACI|nr:hypothetical protein Bca52824_024074 [Brassica carinata]